MQANFNTDATYWPFSRNKKMLTDREKMEVLMLKDVH
jgi:hypothetical protein